MKKIQSLLLLITLIGGSPIGFAQSSWLSPLPEKGVVTKPEETANAAASYQDAAHQFFALKGILKPNQEIPAQVTRAEWAVLLNAAMGDPATYFNDAAFYPDVPHDYWAFKAIEDLRLKGVVPF